MEDIKKKINLIKRKVQIGLILFVGLSVFGYMNYPILTAIADILVIWSVRLWIKRMGIRTVYFKKKK
jgi:hypothetical protein